MTAVVTVNARGLKELRRDLKRADRAIGKEFRQVWLAAARLVAAEAKTAAPGSSGRAITGRATQRAAAVRISARRGDELARFFGARRRAGWYARGRYRDSDGRQFRPWVGNQWDPGEAGGRPHFIGEPINAAAERVVDLVADETLALLARVDSRTPG